MKIQINGPVPFRNMNSYQVVLNGNCSLQIDVHRSAHEARDLAYRIQNAIGGPNLEEIINNILLTSVYR